MKLSLETNDYTEEALKHVYALLWADKSIVVKIARPLEKVELPKKDENDEKNPLLKITEKELVGFAT
jgi:hypothetical protein